MAVSRRSFSSFWLKTKKQSRFARNARRSINFRHPPGARTTGDVHNTFYDRRVGKHIFLDRYATDCTSVRPIRTRTRARV